ncbi:NF-X1-type zinc finger protein NFXL2 [Rhynchospora pubera]|uniref:NF-X1-type zinc finger protein NFXL2 n=1 Tax=Rhynchospora pubera TaxID=906938 RepID=A0AAV8D052_9POAL|nr:NF-X1-type zinc finger protein NFXL2 [Rhynchospora pubera]
MTSFADPISDDDAASSTSGSDGETSQSSSSAVLAGYLKASGGEAPSNLKLQGGPQPSCLICLCRIRLADPVWSCGASCFSLFHLPCIQSWSLHSSSSSAASSSSSSSSAWSCPKCRFPYPSSLVPRSYLCFCAKLQDPPLDPWLLPHSCGAVCARPLHPACGHTCLLLCHPGPCPPCPQLVPHAPCFCGAHHQARRCAHKLFSCANFCNKPLHCGTHPCRQTCHQGDCPPCNVKGNYTCHCGKLQQERACSERHFTCHNPCDGVHSCSKHNCQRGCHAGPCGDCPRQGRTTCPCGKQEYKGLGCDVELPTCGSTCAKFLKCGRHKCPERCHRGPCVETCRTVVIKSCKCGGSKKEVPCYQDLTCERKCQRIRDCGRHACRRRCCDGNCPPCPEICDRRLKCGNHKCPSPCHRGVCSPCPLMVSISCLCGDAHFEVPCGTEKNQKPPKCSKKCPISRLCRHKLQSRPHKCHYGACPPCKLVCGEEFSCGHSCKERCHGPIPPPNPEFTLKPKKKRLERVVEATPGSACSPCKEIVFVSCFGQHLSQERPMVCANKRQFSCDNLCGNPLPCGNHYCTKSCHILDTQSGSTYAEPCEECTLPCQKDRPAWCSHACLLPCHVGNCAPCKALVKRSCHCGSMKHVFECTYYNTLSNEEQLRVRACGGPCHRKLPNCPHLCSEICHPGQCPSIDLCTKKVTVRCSCNGLKKEWICQDVLKAYKNSGRDPKDISKSQFGVGLLACGRNCIKEVQKDDSEMYLRKTHEIKELVAEAVNVPKRKRRRERGKETRHASRFEAIKTTFTRCMWVMLVILVSIMLAYWCYKGIFRLSDWMNEVDEQRLRKRFPRL